MSKAKVFLALGLLLIAGGAIFLLRPPSREEGPYSSTQAQGVSLRGYNEEGALVWSVQAREGEMKEDVGSLSEVKVVFYTAEKEHLQVRADILTFKGKEATLSGEVEAVRHDGYRMRTETLTWIESAEELSAGWVTVSSKAVTVEAQGFRYELKSDRSFLQGGVTATLDRRPVLRVTGERGEEEAGRLSLAGGVLVERGEEAYRCARIEYDPGTEEVRLSGEVEGEFASGTIRAESITLSSDGITADGRVHLLLDQRFFGGEDGA